MRSIKSRYALWQLMLAIAVLGGLFALFGVTGAAAIVVLVSALVLPIRLAGPGGRLRAVAWVTSFYPLLFLASLYATWFTAWLVLGHRPRSWLDDPKFISPIVEVPYVATFLCMMSAPYVLALSFILMLAHVGEGLSSKRIPPWKAAALMLMPLLVWLSVIVTFGWGLFEVRYIAEWYMD